jgi:hypothetical protein
LSVLCAVGSAEGRESILVICKKLVSDGIGILEFFHVGGTYAAMENLENGLLFVVDDNKMKHIVAQSKNAHWENDAFFMKHFEIIRYTDKHSIQFEFTPPPIIIYGMTDYLPDQMH